MGVGLEFNCNDKKLIILNIHTPYDCYQNEDEYLNRLSCVMSFIQDNASTCIYVVCDMNADVSDVNSLFANHLIQFLYDGGLILSSKVLMPDNSYTFISDAWHTTSWLDHCVCTADAHDSLDEMKIIYNLATTDHIPFFILLNLCNVPLLLPVGVTTRRL